MLVFLWYFLTKTYIEYHQIIPLSILYKSYLYFRQTNLIALGQVFQDSELFVLSVCEANVSSLCYSGESTQQCHLVVISQISLALTLTEVMYL